MSLYATVLAPLGTYPIGDYLEDYPDVAVELDRVVPMGGSTHFVWLAGDKQESLVAEIEAGTFDAVAVVEELPDRTLLRIEWECRAPSIFELIETSPAALVRLRGTAKRWAFQLRFPDQESLDSFIRACSDMEIQLELHERFEPDDAKGTPYGVTPRQFDMIEMAYEADYFGVPRQATLADLAAQIGISEQAASERLRRGLAGLLKKTLFED